MHTTGWLAARKRLEIAMVSAGAFTDVGGLGLKAIDPGAVAEILDVFPRLDFKRSVVDSMTSFCKRKPEAVVLSQFAETGRRHIAGYNPPILEDLVLAAPFDS